MAGYGEDFWKFLSSAAMEFGAQSVLEIGCGGCVLLERFKARGLDVVGVDPSPVAAEAAARKGIRVFQEFFPPRSLDVSPDLIFQIDVLEHIEDPLGFLRAQRDSLKRGGLVAINVPDCGRGIELGDISMALHQHVNMYDSGSLARLVQEAGLEIVRIERSGFGAALYCLARNGDVGMPAPSLPADRYSRFMRGAQEAIGRFQQAVGQSIDSGETFGFFMPQRAFPYLGTMQVFSGFRIFDNMNVWHGRYLDGVDMPVENQADLIANPVAHLYVMSLTFGNEVKAAIQRASPQIRITTLEDILRPA